jgi:uncharacterized membrane protein
MSDLIVIAFPDAAAAERARDEVFGFSPDDLAPFSQLSEAVVATRDEHGRIKLSHLVHLWPLKAGTGFLWGLLIGAIFLHPIFGLIGGGAAGLIAGALGDCGIDQEFIKAVKDVLRPGKAALLLRHEYAMPKEIKEGVIERLAAHGGQVLRATLDPTADRKLRRAIQAARRRTSDVEPMEGAVPGSRP